MLKYNSKMGYLTVAPPRDLTDEDVKQIEEQEGVTKEDLIASGATGQRESSIGNGKLLVCHSVPPMCLSTWLVGSGVG